MSHHVTFHVTVMSHTPSSSLKEKEKEIQKKKNIKLRKIDKRKRKMLVFKVFHNKEEAAKSEVEAKELVPEKFHKWIKVFEEKQSERMPMRKMSRGVRGSGGTKKKFLWKQNLKRGVLS